MERGTTSKTRKRRPSNDAMPPSEHSKGSKSAKHGQGSSTSPPLPNALGENQHEPTTESDAATMTHDSSLRILLPHPLEQTEHHEQVFGLEQHPPRGSGNAHMLELDARIQELERKVQGLEELSAASKVAQDAREADTVPNVAADHIDWLDLLGVSGEALLPQPELAAGSTNTGAVEETHAEPWLCEHNNSPWDCDGCYDELRVHLG